MGKGIHYDICKHYGVDCEDKLYEQAPEPVVGSTDVKILWDFISQTDKKLPHNRSSIVVVEKTNKTCEQRIYDLIAIFMYSSDIVIIYCSLICSVLEYASVVFANLPRDLSLALEKVQKKSSHYNFRPCLGLRTSPC